LIACGNNEGPQKDTKRHEKIQATDLPAGRQVARIYTDYKSSDSNPKKLVLNKPKDNWPIIPDIRKINP